MTSLKFEPANDYLRGGRSNYDFTETIRLHGCLNN